ncbi:MAG: hypothetical protein WA666_07645 [Nitrospirota bacterium]
MDNFWANVLTNVVANWINLSIVAIISIFLLFYINLSKRKKLFKLLGLYRRSEIKPNIEIYVSTIRVLKNGALFSDGTRAVNFESITVGAAEVFELTTLEKIFEPGILKYVPTQIKNKLIKWNIAFTEINPDFQPSPTDLSQIKNNNIILLGGPDFNAATRAYLNKNEAIMRFLPKATRSKPYVEILCGNSKGQVVSPHKEKMDLAIIQKQTMKEDDRVILILAGNGSNGTRAAIKYFAKHWEELYKRYQERDFSLCLQCEERELNPQGYESWNVIRTIPEEPL